MSREFIWSVYLYPSFTFVENASTSHEHKSLLQYVNTESWLCHIIYLAFVAYLLHLLYYPTLYHIRSLVFEPWILSLWEKLDMLIWAATKCYYYNACISEFTLLYATSVLGACKNRFCSFTIYWCSTVSWQRCKWWKYLLFYSLWWKWHDVTWEYRLMILLSD